MLRAAPPGHPLQKPTVVQWDIGAMLSADGAADESVSPQSGIKGGNHTFPHSETVRDLPVRRAQGACVRISKGWKRLVISRPQETRLQYKRFGALDRGRLPEYLR